VIVFGGALFFWNRNKAIVFGLFFYLINVALVLQFVSVGSAIYAERYSYMAYVGLFFLFAMGLDKLVEKGSFMRIAVYAITSAICIGLCWLTFNQSKTWKDSISLWSQQIKVYPDRAFGHKKIAEYFMDNGNDQKAFEKFDYLVKRFPKGPRVRMGRANMLGKMGKYELALKDYEIALSINSDLTEIYVNRAITYSILKQYENAFKDYEKALFYEPNNYQIHINRGFAYIEYGDFEKAISDFTIVLQLQPNNQRIHFMRALAYHRANKLESAVLGYNAVLQINPNNPDAYHNRAICFEAEGKYKQALEGILKAQKLGKQENEAYIQKLQKLANQ
jgi:tetratricopeptide (TPR) repeat protein